MYSLRKFRDYNEIIRKNPRTTRFLEREGLFPIRNIILNISTLNKDGYLFLLDKTGEKNTNYLINLLNKFDRNWIIYNSLQIKPANASLNLSTKKLEVVRNLTELLDTDTLDVSSIGSFKSFENRPYKNPMESMLSRIHEGNCAKQEIQYSLGSHKGLLILGLEYNKISLLK